MCSPFLLPKSAVLSDATKASICAGYRLYTFSVYYPSSRQLRVTDSNRDNEDQNLACLPVTLTRKTGAGSGTCQKHLPAHCVPCQAVSHIGLPQQWRGRELNPQPKDYEPLVAPCSPQPRAEHRSPGSHRATQPRRSVTYQRVLMLRSTRGTVGLPSPP